MGCGEGNCYIFLWSLPIFHPPACSRKFVVMLHGDGDFETYPRLIFPSFLGTVNPVVSFIELDYTEHKILVMCYGVPQKTTKFIGILNEGWE